MRELTDAGYYRWRRVQTPAGFRMVTEVAALPSLMPPLPGHGISGPGKPASGEPASGASAPVVSTETQHRESDTPPTTSGAPAVAEPAKPKRKATRTRIAEPFVITDHLREWAAANAGNVVDLEAETLRFVDWHVGRASTMADWDRAWMTWMRRADGQASSGSTVGRRPASSNRTTAGATADDHARIAGLFTSGGPQ